MFPVSPTLVYIGVLPSTLFRVSCRCKDLILDDLEVPPNFRKPPTLASSGPCVRPQLIELRGLFT